MADQMRGAILRVRGKFRRGDPDGQRIEGPRAGDCRDQSGDWLDRAVQDFDNDRRKIGEMKGGSRPAHVTSMRQGESGSRDAASRVYARVSDLTFEYPKRLPGRPNRSWRCRSLFGGLSGASEGVLFCASIL